MQKAISRQSVESFWIRCCWSLSFNTKISIRNLLVMQASGKLMEDESLRKIVLEHILILWKMMQWNHWSVGGEALEKALAWRMLDYILGGTDNSSEKHVVCGRKNAKASQWIGFWAWLEGRFGDGEGNYFRKREWPGTGDSFGTEDKPTIM